MGTWQDKPTGKVVIGVIVAVIAGLLLWFITNQISTQRDTPPTVVIERVTEPKIEDKAVKPELAEPRKPSVQRTEVGKKETNPQSPIRLSANISEVVS